jgi:succinoglycan biosynthesis protein ExoA
MILSVICPVFNEARYIDEVVHFFNNALPKEKELFFIDGESTDNTRKLISAAQQKNANIFLLSNPHRIVPYALNLAIPVCKADIIVRIDAHSKYDLDYFIKILDTFKKTDADIVGGPTRTAHTGRVQEAVAHAICTPFGIGDSKVHDVAYRGYTDSVTFGAWKKSIFNSIGFFDTDLKRNQDDEFHYRAKSHGFKIYQNPDIKLYYYPRDTIKGLFRQYYEYGFYKPLVLKKIKSEAKLRHFIPSLFLIYLLTLPFTIISMVWLIPLMLYLIMDFGFGLLNKKRMVVKSILFVVYPTIHIAYGLGFISYFLKRKK